MKSQGIIHRCENNKHVGYGENEEEEETEADPLCLDLFRKARLHSMKEDGCGKGEDERIGKEENHDGIINRPHPTKGKYIVGIDYLTNGTEKRLKDEEDQSAPGSG